MYAYIHTYKNHYYAMFCCSIINECMHAVSLNSSAARVCPGDTLVFTCVTNTSSLLWNMNGTTQNSFFYEQEQLQSTETLDIFSINLISITGTTFVSTATVHNVSIEDDKTIITCSDSNQVEKSAEVNLSGSYYVHMY